VHKLTFRLLEARSRVIYVINISGSVAGATEIASIFFGLSH